MNDVTISNPGGKSMVDAHCFFTICWLSFWPGVTKLEIFLVFLYTVKMQVMQDNKEVEISSLTLFGQGVEATPLR